jgi:uncharacterized membrane protein YkgB
MIDNIIRIYKIGKELGLTKSEISSLIFFKNPKHRMLSIVLFIILVVITVTTLSVLIVFANIEIERYTYPTGARYSTVKLKNFRLKGGKLRIKRKN